MLLSQLVSVLLLRVLAAIASLSVCDECSCQFLFAKQSLLHSKNLYAMRVVQVVAVDWIFSFRIKCVGLEPIFGSYDVTENRAVLNILEGQ